MRLSNQLLVQIYAWRIYLYALRVARDQLFGTSHAQEANNELHQSELTDQLALDRLAASHESGRQGRRLSVHHSLGKARPYSDVTDQL